MGLFRLIFSLVALNLNFEVNELFGDGRNLADTNGLPLEEETADSLVHTRTTKVGNGSTYQTYFFRPASLVESNHRLASDVFNSSQQGPSVELRSVRSSNGDADRSASRSDSPRHRLDEQILPPMTEQALRPSKRKPFENDARWASASLGPAHTSKVLTAARNKGLDLSGDGTSHRRYPLVTYHYPLVWMQ